MDIVKLGKGEFHAEAPRPRKNGEVCPTASPRRYIVKQPPVQRPGYIEEVETEYTAADPPPQPARRKAANGA